MSESDLLAAHHVILDGLAQLCALENTADGQQLIDEMKFHQLVLRQVQQATLRVVARLDHDGEFTQRGTHTGPAVADLLQLTQARARQLVSLAQGVFPTSLQGEALTPVLESTAVALADYGIGRAHAEVIDRALRTASARRLTPGRWSDVETQLAEWGRTRAPHELARMAEELIDKLDQDGAEDREPDDQLNELNLSRNRDGIGGRIKGRLDSSTFDAVSQAIKGLLPPKDDEQKTLEQRQADALGALCEHVLDEGALPEAGGEAPHVTVTLSYQQLLDQLRGATLSASGCRIGPGEARRLACDAKIIPIVLGGQSEPLDVGREQRLATRYLRRAVATRDGGCAHPGCGKPANFCQVHHIVHWVDGGATEIDNLVMLCRTHHRMVHTAGWIVRIRDGLPEFIPPKWLDYHQTPRLKPHYPAGKRRDDLSLLASSARHT